MTSGTPSFCKVQAKKKGAVLPTSNVIPNAVRNLLRLKYATTALADSSLRSE